MKPTPLLQGCRVKVIVVPIYPQTVESFNRYFNIISGISCVALGELTVPDARQSVSGKFNDQLFHDGSLFYEFVQSYNRDLGPLEDIELGRQIFGVIGVMNCGQIPNLAEGYRQFQQITQRYPNSMVHRCFAFEPKEDQLDDTKGIIMIPNVGDISFYLQTMINDLTTDLLTGFSSLANQLEKRSVIQMPLLISQTFQQEVESPAAMSPVASPVVVKMMDSSGNLLNAESQLSQYSQPSSISFVSSILNPDKTKKRTPARSQKLLADLYLMVGRLDLATASYLASIEGAKGALNSLITSEELVELAYRNENVNGFVVDLPEKFRDIIQLYDKALPYGTIGYYPLLQIFASLKIAEFLAVAHKLEYVGQFLNGAGIGWFSESKSLGAEIAARITTAPGLPQLTSQTSSLILQPGQSQTEKAILQNGLGATKTDVLSWINRAWACGAEYLSLKDQILSLTEMSAICSIIKANRKHAFYLRMLALISHEFKIKSGTSNTSRKQKKSGPVACLEIVARILGNYQDSDNDDEIWLEEFGPEPDITSSRHSTTHLIQNPFNKPSFGLRFGWIQLRIGNYKEAIAIAESEQDHVNTILLTAQLLRKLFKSLTAKDKQHYSDLLQKVVMFHKKQSSSSKFNNSSLFSMIKGGHGIVLGIPLVRKLEIVHPSPQYTLTKHQPKMSEGKKETFLYSPFAKKEKGKKELFFSTNEVINIDVTLANPYLFDIDVQMMGLHSTDVNFKPMTISTLIPAETKAHVVRLCCIPSEAGKLDITGIDVKMLGGCIEETLHPLQQFLADTKKYTKDGKLKKQREQERFGKKELSFVSKSQKKEAQEKIAPWTLSIDVIQPQPALELLETSLGSHQAITLYEGERAFYPLNEPQVPFVTDPFPIGSMISHMTKVGHSEPVRLKILIAPGEQHTIHLGVFGKKDCTGGTIRLSYGSIGEDQKEVFFTRELVIPFLLTVVDALQFRNADILYYTNSSNNEPVDALLTPNDRSISVEEMMMNPRLSTSVEADGDTNSFLLTFDIRNEWDEPFKVTFDIFESEEDTTPKSSSTTILHANVTKRIILPVSRLLLPREHIQKPIPTPPGKQFVVGQATRVPEGLRRALFWYREAIIGGLSCRGRSKRRSGILTFRNFELTPRMLHIVKSSTVNIDVKLSSADQLEQTGPLEYRCSKHSMVNSTWTISNYQETPCRLIFRLLPIQETHTGEPVMESGQIITVGSLNRVLPTISPQGSFSFGIPLIFPSVCNLKILAQVEYIHEKKEVVKKSKYEEAELILDEIETLNWLKPRLSMSVVEF
ncbi:hypothetical protein HK103_001944 [Boothiomyces macroporosus]|uniref:Uncharacterized protein n=1 Tax=Boothiomyces macroporosus TaxID=261099 RepID=A0AAD5UJA1_9FUNG|nr:hypothetical protein HK103_001944 [Boothiomyces macroporosus]